VTLTQKIQKPLSLRKLLFEEREKVTLLWVPSHMVITGNAKAALKDDLLSS
jgi:hypothetical protein